MSSQRSLESDTLPDLPGLKEQLDGLTITELTDALLSDQFRRIELSIDFKTETYFALFSDLE